MKRLQRATTLSTESIEQFHAWCLGRGLSKHTCKAYRSDLLILLAESGKTAIPMESLEEAAQKWLNLSRPLLSPKTTGRRLTSVKVWAKWAGDPLILDDYMPPHTARGIAHPISEGKDGLLRMIDAASNPEQKALVSLTGLIGCRISEARDTRPSWFNLHDMTVSIRGKGDKTRIVPVSDEAWAAISECYAEAILRGNDSCLITYSDRPARRVITALGERAKLSRPIASHDMRHTFATLVFERTRNIRLVQELLGHGNVTTTEIYTGVNEAALREAVQF